MFLQNRILIIYSLMICTLICSVVALKCDKLITTNDKATTEDRVFDEGIYHVKTTLQRDSAEIQELILSLKGISIIKHNKLSFTATLQPKHIKKLCKDDHVIHIRQIERIKHEIKCNKLLKGNSSNAVQDSYIVMTVDHILSAADLNSIEIASESIDSSVMIASSTPLYGSNNGFIMKMNDAAVEYICDLPLVDYIEEDQEIGIASSTTQWHLDRIDQESLPLDHKYNGLNGGSDVDIYIFDTGINYKHNEFDRKRAKYSGIDPVDILHSQNQNGLDCQGHGTHVAGLAGGKTIGVAKKATLYSVRVLDCFGYGSTSTIVIGLNHVIGLVQEKQSSKKKVKAIINMSLTTKNTYSSRAMREAITKAVDSGILVVAAAGNYKSDACQYSPSSFTNVVTVGGTQRTDELYKTFFYGTNYGSCVDIFAPGQQVQSAYYSGPESYATFDGTSQATPLVSGAAAIYWNMLPDGANASQVKEQLLKTCSKGKLKIAASVPSPFNQQTKNCLLHIQDISPPKNNLPVSPSGPPPAQKAYHRVSFDELETLITEMQQQNYALSYLQTYLSSANTTSYNLVFKHMKRRKFQTHIFITEANVKEIADKLRPKKLKITFIHDLLIKKLKRFIIVLAKDAKYQYRVFFRVKSLNIQQVQDNSAAERITLYSTSVIPTTKQGNAFQTLLYSNQTRIPTHFQYNINKTSLFTTVKDEVKNGYHLKYLSSYAMKNGEQYALVFHKFTKPDEKYRIIYNIKSKNIQKKVDRLITEGNTINVVAGIWQPTSDNVQYLVAYEST